MSQRIAYLEAVVGADISNYRRQMAEVRNDMGFLAENFRGLGRVAQQMSFAVSLPIAAIGSAMVNVGMQFDESMRNVNSIAQLSEQSFQDLSQEVLNFSKTTKAGATEAADALYEVFSAGVADTATAMEIMQVAVHTSEAGLADLAATTKGLTSLTLAYSNTNYQAADASNALTRTVQVGVGTMEEFVSNIGRVAPVASSLGINFEELGASWAFMTQRGTSASRAATEMAAVMKGLLKPSSDLEAVINSLGAATGKELIANMGGFKETIEAIWQAAGQSEAVLAEWFPDARQIRGLTKIVNDTEAWSQAIQEFNTNLDEATSSALEEQQKSLAYQFGRVTSAAEAFAVTVSQKLQPALMPIAKHIENFFHGLSNLEPEILQVGIAVSTLLMVLPPLLWLFASMMNPVGLLTTAIGGLVTAFSVDLYGVQSKVKDTVEGILGEEGFKKLEEGVQAFVRVLNDAFGGPDVLQGPLEEPTDLPNLFPQEMTGTGSTYTVKKGDTAWGIWFEHYKEDFNEFDEWLRNTDLTDASLILEGQIITVGDNVRNTIRESFSDPFSGAMGGGGQHLIGWSTEEALGDREWQPMMGEDIGFFGRLVKSIQEELPTILSALETVGQAISNWFLYDAIPSVSYSIGYFVGQIGAEIGKALQNLGSYFEAAGNAGGEVAEYGKNNIADPLVEGFNAAMADYDISSTGDQIATVIAGAIGTALLGASVVGFLANGIVGLISNAFSMAGLMLSGAQMLGSGIGAILFGKNAAGLAAKLNIGSAIRGAISTGLDVATKPGTSGVVTKAAQYVYSFVQGGLFEAGKMIILDASGALGGFKDKIYRGVNWAMKAAAGLVTSASTGVTSIISSIATAIGAGSLTVTLGTLVVAGALVVLISSEMNRQIEEAFKDEDITKTVQESVSDYAGTASFDLFDFSSSDYDTGMSRLLEIQEIVSKFGNLNINEDLGTIDLAFKNLQNLTPEQMQAMKDLFNFEDSYENLEPELKNFVMTVLANLEEEMNRQGSQFNLWDIVTGAVEIPDTPEGGSKGALQSIVGSALGTVDTLKGLFTMDDSEVKQTVKDTLGDPLADAIAESIDQEGFTATPIVENFINVIDEAWVGAFGETGTTRLAWSGFVTELTNSIDTVTGAIVIMALTVPITLGTMYTLSLIPLNAMIGKLGELTEAIGGVSGALGSLTNNPLIQLMLGGNVVASGLMPANTGGGANGGGDTYNVTSYGTSPRELVTTMEKANNSTGTGNWSP